MFRIDDPSASPTLPTPEAAGTEGYFTEGNPGVTAASLVRAAFLNMIQEELRNVVVAGGLTPSKTTYNQVLSALQAMFVGMTSATGAATLPAGTTAQRPGTPVAGEVRVNTDLGSVEAYIAGAWGSVGKVVQMVSAMSTTNISTTSSAQLDSVSITPKSSTSKIVALGFASIIAVVGGSNAQVGFFITKAGTQLGAALSGGNITANGCAVPFCMFQVDASVVAGTPITYGATGRVDSAGTASINTTGTQHGIILLEIDP